MNVQMLDFDEILLTIKNPKIKKYLEESIKSYRIGNFRSAIITVWIATMFDLVKKFQILTDQREPTAIKKWKELEPKIKEHKNWERELIDFAEKSDMLSKYESEKIRDLQKTRNLYAHPSFDDVGDLFEPSPEEVRYFIRTLYDIVLSQPAQLGAFYVNDLIEKIKEPNFYRTTVYIDELGLLKDFVIEKIKLVNSKQFPRLINELFKSLAKPHDKSHEINILCFLVNLWNTENELNLLIALTSRWDEYIINNELTVTIIEAILNYPECIKKLSEKSQLYLRNSIKSKFSVVKLKSELFKSFFNYSSENIIWVESLLNEILGSISVEEAIKKYNEYCYYFGNIFCRLFDRKIFDKLREVLQTGNGYIVNPIIDSFSSNQIWKIANIAENNGEENKFTEELIYSFNRNNWSTVKLLSFENRNYIPKKWINIILSQWLKKLEENNQDNSYDIGMILRLGYFKHFLGLFEFYINNLDIIQKENAVRVLVYYLDISDDLLINEALNKIAKDTTQNTLWEFWQNLLEDNKHIITSTKLQEITKKIIILENT